MTARDLLSQGFDEWQNGGWSDLLATPSIARLLALADAALAAQAGAPRTRIGRRSDRLGKDNERRLERRFGWEKIGEYGGPIDLLGRSFMVQSKATRTPPPAWLLSVDAPEAHRPPTAVLETSGAMLATRSDLLPLVVTSYVRHGRPTRDWFWVRATDWQTLHGEDHGDGWVVMDGNWFLGDHGRDEP